MWSVIDIGGGVESVYTLRKVDMDAVIINQNSLHLEICLLAVLLVLEFDKCILKAVFCALVSNDFAGHYWPEAAEYRI